MDQPRTPPAPSSSSGIDLRGGGLGRHGPDHAARGDLVVGPPRRSYGYAWAPLAEWRVVGPPRVRSRGAPVTVHSTVAAYPHSSATC
jgi:hypothetical protein